MLQSCQKNVSLPSKNNGDIGTLNKQDPKLIKDFKQVNLVGNNDEYEPLTIDPNLINAWGLAFSWWRGCMDLKL
jgi:hypothetical protein